MQKYIHKSSVKYITIPFNGFYQSLIDYDLIEQLGEHIDWISESDSLKSEHLQEWLDNADLSYAYKGFYMLVASQLVKYMQDKLNDEYGASINFYSIDYEDMSLQNTGDNINGFIESKDLPSLELICDYTGLSIDELFSELQLLSDGKFKSCDGFHSFYNHNITPLKGVELSYWNDAYLSLILDFLVNDFFSGANGLEQAFLDDSNSYGGMIELFLQCLNSDDLNTFNSFE